MMELSSSGLGCRDAVLRSAAADGAPVSNLAALLDRFTHAITHPEDETVGNFAQTVEQLHGELALLAGHFGISDGECDLIDFDAIFPEGAPEAVIEPGLAAGEELAHLCGLLSR